MLYLAASSYADDGAVGEYQKFCFPSYDELVKLEDDENIQVIDYGAYVYVIDRTPPKDWGRSYYKKEKTGKYCLIADFSADETSVSYSDKGELVQIVASSWYPREQSETIIIYKADKTGYLSPSECSVSYSGRKKEPFDCHGRFFPNFDCSNPKKLNQTEQIICNNYLLSSWDLTLASNYKALRSANIGNLRDKLTSDQREWIKRRNECKDNEDCLFRAYRERTDEVCNNYPVVSGFEPYCSNPKPFASFDCSNPEILDFTEQTICRSERLSGYDSTLARNYKALLAADIGELRNKLIRDQDEWLKRRNKCKDSSGCLSYMYGERISDLCNNYPVVSGPKPYCRNAVTYPMVYCYNRHDSSNINLAEQTICNDKGLLYSWDLTLGQNYEAFQNSDIDGLQNKLIHDQVEWVKRRNECKDNEDCLLEAYMMRNYEICNIYPVVSGPGPICHRPDYNCYDAEKFSLAEQTVCKAGGLLSSWRNILADNYDAFMGSDIGGLQNKLVRDQIEWFKRRDECKDNKDCLLEAYVKRSNEICNNYPVVSGSKPDCMKRDETTLQ
jgi:uncharacterized protein